MILHRRLVRGRSALAATAAAALAVCGLSAVATPAQAAPAFIGLEASFDANLQYGGPCARKSLVTAQPPVTTLPDSGSLAKTITGTQQLAPTAGDPTTMTENVSQKVTAQTKAQGSRPVGLRLRSTFSATTTAAAGNTCTSRATTLGRLTFQLATTQPMWLTVDVAKRGKIITVMQLVESSNSSAEVQIDIAKTASGRTTILLPAGAYQGNLQAGYQGEDTASSSVSTGEADIALGFAPLGSATAAPSGAALGYTSIGSARSCSAHALNVGVTKSASKFKRIAKVSWSVNGKTVKTLKGRSLKRGAKAKLKLSDTRSASVRAVVKLRNGKTRTATANYRPCA